MKILIFDKELLNADYISGWKNIPNSRNKFRLEFIDDTHFNIFLKSHNPLNLPLFTQYYAKCHIVSENVNQVEAEVKFVMPLFNKAVTVFVALGWFSNIFLDRESFESHRVIIYFIILFLMFIHLYRFKMQLKREMSKLLYVYDGSMDRL